MRLCGCKGVNEEMVEDVQESVSVEKNESVSLKAMLCKKNG